METVHQRLYRNWISLKTLVIFFFASYRRWPFFVWFHFWFSKYGAPHSEKDAPNITPRRGTFREKIIDSHIIFTNTAEYQYEPAGFEVRAGDIVVDIGAHLGSFALFAALRGASVIACEPSPENFRLLSTNLACNNITRIIALQKCVAGASGVRTLNLDRQNPARNGLYGVGNAVSVPALSLAELFRQQGIVHCDFLKMDCEGAEYEIIDAAPKETLATIKRIAMEYHLPPYFGLNTSQHKLANLSEKLARAGFSIKIIPENKLRGLLFATR